MDNVKEHWEQLLLLTALFNIYIFKILFIHGIYINIKKVKLYVPPQDKIHSGPVMKRLHELLCFGN